MKNPFLFLVVLLTMQLSSAQKPAVILNDKPGWHKIGETTVNFRTESDEILLIGADRFTALKFKVTDAPVLIKSIEVFFDKGDTQKIPVEMTLKASGESDAVPLEGGERKVKRISFIYKTLSNPADNKARIEVSGLKE